MKSILASSSWISFTSIYNLNQLKTSRHPIKQQDKEIATIKLVFYGTKEITIASHPN